MAVRRQRLDAELVRRGLAQSREHAAELISQGRVKAGGVLATKPATAVTTDSPVVVSTQPGEHRWVSRGAHKLLGALAAFPDLGVEGRRCLDAGASTGGFTEVLLRAGAREVLAVDVGYGQLAWALQSDSRVQVFDRQNVRELDQGALGGKVDLVVADLSFISLALVLPALAAIVEPRGDMCLMVKPQFEVGRDRVGKKGVVREPNYRAAAVRQVAQQAGELGWGAQGVCTSPLPGPAGNIEYFLWLQNSAATIGDTEINNEVAAGVNAEAN